MVRARKIKRKDCKMPAKKKTYTKQIIAGIIILIIFALMFYYQQPIQHINEVLLVPNA